MAHRQTSHQEKLTDEQTTQAISRMMLGAEAHFHASIYCQNNPDAKPPKKEGLYFIIVSYELLFMSIEQSLRLSLLMKHSLRDSTHNIHALYIKLLRKNKNDEEMKFATDVNIKKCLKKHASSYGIFRYVGLKRNAQLSSEWGITSDEGKILYCLAKNLLKMNSDEMCRRGIEKYGEAVETTENPESKTYDR